MLVNSGGYLRRRSSSVNIHHYSPPLRRIIVLDYFSTVKFIDLQYDLFNSCDNRDWMWICGPYCYTVARSRARLLFLSLHWFLLFFRISLLSLVGIWTKWKKQLHLHRQVLCFLRCALELTCYSFRQNNCNKRAITRRLSLERYFVKQSEWCFCAGVSLMVITWAFCTKAVNELVGKNISSREELFAWLTTEGGKRSMWLAAHLEDERTVPRKSGNDTALINF